MRREKLAIRPSKRDALLWLRRIQQGVRIRALGFWQRRHAKSNLWNTRCALREKAKRGQPRSCAAFLHKLPETDINGIVVFCQVAVDVVQAAVANLNVDLARKYQLQKAGNAADNTLRTVPNQGGQDSVRYHPCSDVPVRRSSALVLRLEHILVDDEPTDTQSGWPGSAIHI